MCFHRLAWTGAQRGLPAGAVRGCRLFLAVPGHPFPKPQPLLQPGGELGREALLRTFRLTLRYSTRL